MERFLYFPGIQEIILKSGSLPNFSRELAAMMWYFTKNRENLQFFTKCQLFGLNCIKIFGENSSHWQQEI